MRVLWVVAAVAAVLLLPGCLTPFRVHVDPDVLAAADPRWTETPSGVQGSFPGTRSRETRYAFDAGATPPFAGSLQVFSLRGLDRDSRDELVGHANRLVANGAEQHSIQLDGPVLEGSRTLRSGVDTRWVLRSGTTTESGDLFDDNVEVRILAEVGHDGRSNTSFLAVAMAQVARTTQCGPLPGCTPTQSSEVTWLQLVGDDDGSVQGAVSQTGFIDHLVTR